MVYAIVFVLLVLIDQISKAVAFAVWGCPSGLSYFLGNFLGIDTLVNTGISGGIGSDRPWALPCSSPSPASRSSRCSSCSCA